MYKNPYLTCSREELVRTAKDYIRSKNEGCRCEALVPYASDLRHEAHDDIHMFNLAKYLSIAEKDFTYALATRLIQDADPSCTVLDMRTFQMSEDDELLLIEASQPDLFNSKIGHSVLTSDHEIAVVLDGGEASDCTLPASIQPHAADARSRNCNRIIYSNHQEINRMPYEDMPSEDPV